MRTKVMAIRCNWHKYFRSAVCKCLKASRSSCYYEVSSKLDEKALETRSYTAFHANRDVYGSCKMKKEIAQKGLQISYRHICRIMK